MAPPWGYVQVKARTFQRGAGTIVGNGTELIRKPEGAVGQKIQIDGKVTLGPGRRVVYHDQGTVIVAIMPRAGDKIIPGVITFPRGPRLPEVKFTLMNLRAPKIS